MGLEDHTQIILQGEVHPESPLLVIYSNKLNTARFHSPLSLVMLYINRRGANNSKPIISASLI